MVNTIYRKISSEYEIYLWVGPRIFWCTINFKTQKHSDDVLIRMPTHFVTDLHDNVHK